MTNTVIIWGVPSEIGQGWQAALQAKFDFACSGIICQCLYGATIQPWCPTEPLTPGALHLCGNHMHTKEIVMMDDTFRVVGDLINMTYEDMCARYQMDRAREMIAVPGFTAAFLTVLADAIHGDNVNAGWWTDIKTGEDLHGKRNIPEMLMLSVSELAEAMEAYRKNLKDDKLPWRPGLRVEVADCMIRLFDLMGSEDNDMHPLGVLLEEKRAFNRRREDHRVENRLKDGGKVF